MTTSVANLDVTQYVRVNIGLHPITMQAHRDAVRIVFSNIKPALSNTAFHLITGGDPPMVLPFNDVNVWALATTEHSSLIITEFTQHDPGAISQGSKDVFVTDFGGTVEGATSGASTAFTKQSDRRDAIKGTGLIIRPGVQFTVGVRGVDGAQVVGDILVSLRWVEEF